MKINTKYYEASHGKRPKGYGLWFFQLSYPKGRVETFHSTGKYGEAQRMALRFASSTKAEEVAVLA